VALLISLLAAALVNQPDLTTSAQLVKTDLPLLVGPVAVKVATDCGTWWDRQCSSRGVSVRGCLRRAGQPQQSGRQETHACVYGLWVSGHGMRLIAPNPAAVSCSKARCQQDTQHQLH
jgi:hypothetical protein